MAVSAILGDMGKTLGKELASGFVQGIAGEAAGEAFGGFLSAIGLGEDETAQQQLEQGDTQIALAEQQVALLTSVDRKLTEINNNLTEIKGEIVEVNDTLHLQLEEAKKNQKYKDWNKANGKLITSATLIGTAFNTYQSFLRQTQKISNDTTKAFVVQVLDGTDSIKAQVATIHENITSLGDTDGALLLYAKMLATKIIYPKDAQVAGVSPGAALYSNQLTLLVNQLTNYFAELLIRQLYAATMVVEGHNYRKESGLAKDYFRNTYLKNIEEQSKYFFKAVGFLMEAWLGEIAETPWDFQFNGTENELKRFNAKDLRSFSSLTEWNGRPSTDIFLSAEPLQDFLVNAETLVYNFTRIHPGQTRIVTYGFYYSGIIHAQVIKENNASGTHSILNDFQDIKENNKFLLRPSNLTPASFTGGGPRPGLKLNTTVYGNQAYAFLRQTIDINLGSSFMALDLDFDPDAVPTIVESIPSRSQFRVFAPRGVRARGVHGDMLVFCPFTPYATEQI